MIKPSRIDVIQDTTVINPENGVILENHDICLKDGRIKEIVPNSSTSGPHSLDGSHYFALPGLIDTHVHALGFLQEDIPGPFDLKWVFRQQRKNLAAFLKSGVTTIRDMAGPLKLIRRKSRQAAGNKIQAPRILYAGPMFTVRHGYPYFIPKTPLAIRWLCGSIRQDVGSKSPDRSLHRMIDKVAAAGATCLKVGFQSAKYDDDQTEIPLLPLPLFRRIVDHAHQRGLPVAVHHVYRRDLQVLLGASDIIFDSLEHLTIDEPLSPAEIDLLAQRNIPISTTLMTYGLINHLERLETLIHQEPARFEEKPRLFLNQVCQALRSGGQVSRYIGRHCIERGSTFMKQNLKNLFRAGLKIVYGTDSGGAVTPPGCPTWELHDMIEAGMKPLDVLRSATSTAADVIGHPDLGRLKPGARADIILLSQNPLQDVAALEHVAAVIQTGRLVHQNTGSV
ncbi:amidohydrolase family protein [candidate division CSSED10-310 bacterium]|uniref:Amidohydrolase family protein n=1 Tax=candidate division CSSED10-310 bacterium TaxID=2855610 RepID=A0ABV6YSH0_UNCC1